MKKIFVSLYLFSAVIFLFMHFVFNPLAGKVMERYVRDILDTYYQDITRGVFYLLVKDMEKLPADQWPDYIEALKPEFGYPLYMEDYRKNGLSTEEIEKLLSGSIVVKQDGQMFYRHVPGSNIVLVMDIPDLEPDLAFFNAGAWICVAFVVCIFVFIWSIPFGRRLNAISTAAIAFGNGRFDARVSIYPHSSLAPIAGAFNRMADRIQQLITAHKELVNAVSHELRTPISRIRFGLEMLRSSPSGADEYIAGVDRDIDELDELVTELLTYARFDRDTLHVKLEMAGIIPWLASEVEKARIGTTDIAVHLDTDGIEPDMKAGIETRHMSRALNNLMQNAIRYACSQVCISIEKRGEYCLIHVDDDGPGIPPEDRERIFEPFVRLDTSRDRDSGGYGIGLAIVRRIAVWHGGSASVSGSSLGGARLTIQWPGFREIE